MTQKIHAIVEMLEYCSIATMMVDRNELLRILTEKRRRRGEGDDDAAMYSAMIRFVRDIPE